MDPLYDPDQTDSSEQDEDTDSEDEMEDEGDSDTGSVSSSSNTFVLLSDPFSDKRPGNLPCVVQDFPDVHPEVGWFLLVKCRPNFELSNNKGFLLALHTPMSPQIC